MKNGAESASDRISDISGGLTQLPFLLQIIRMVL